MPFNEKKCQAINFGRETLTSYYKLGALLCLEWVEHTKDIRVTIQCDLQFDQRINDKCPKSRRLLGGIKHFEVKLIAYTSLLKYAEVV